MILKNIDCLDGEGLLSLPNQSVDMILADPPYGITSNKWDSTIPMELMWKELNRVIKDNGAICLFSKGIFGAKLAISNERFFRYEWIWVKDNATGFLNAKRMPLQAHENILVFYKHLPTYNPQKTPGKPYTVRGHSVANNYNYGLEDRIETINETGDRYPRDVIKFNTERGLHATQKPVPLLEYLIKTYTNPGDTVLDFCMGSGSTGVACQNTKREFIGFEKDPDIFNIAYQRLNPSD